MNEIDDLKAADVELEESIEQVTAAVAENEADINSNTASINTINSNLASNDPKSFPRFWVYYSEYIYSGTDYSPLKFNSVEYNTGAMYSTSTGKVTIPVTGLYNFSVNLRKRAGSNGSAYFYIYINGSGYSRSYT